MKEEINSTLLYISAAKRFKTLNLMGKQAYDISHYTTQSHTNHRELTEVIEELIFTVTNVINHFIIYLSRENSQIE